MSTTPEKRQIIAGLIAETKALHDAIVHITLAWAEIENGLALLLGRILMDPSNAMASAIYFTPANTDTRIAIVSAAMKMGNGGSPLFPKLEAAWTTFVNSLNRKKKVRNQVAHGQIVTIGLNQKNHVRLTAPMFDSFRIGGPLSEKRLPGLSSHDIQQSAASIHKLAAQTHIFGMAVEAIQHSDEPALLSALAQLIPDPSTDSPQPDDQTPPTPRPQHES